MECFRSMSRRRHYGVSFSLASSLSCRVRRVYLSSFSEGRSMNNMLLAVLNSDLLELATPLQHLAALIRTGDVSLSLGNAPTKGVTCVLTFQVGIQPIIANGDNVIEAVRVAVIEARERGLLR